jgi:Flp pilus assembly protein TadG
MKKNGQALVEFIIILPLIIYIIMAAVDIAVIMYNKNNLESKMDDVISLYKEGKTVNEINTFLNKDLDNVSFNVSSDNKYTTITVIKKQEILTPGLDKILGNPYKVKVERVILNE